MFDQLGNSMGRAISDCSRWLVRSGHTIREGDLPEGGAVVITWHGAVMLTLATHIEVRSTPYHGFVTPGFKGAVMRGWLEGSGMEAVLLAHDGEGPSAEGLRRMGRALKEGQTVGIAVDGPRGPRHVLRPGALWLARLSGKPVVPVGVAAGPAIHLPRWDRHLLPLPGACFVVAYRAPIVIPRGTAIDDALCAYVTDELNEAERRAWEILGECKVPLGTADENA